MKIRIQLWISVMLIIAGIIAISYHGAANDVYHSADSGAHAFILQIASETDLQAYLHSRNQDTLFEKLVKYRPSSTHDYAYDQFLPIGLTGLGVVVVGLFGILGTSGRKAQTVETAP